MTLNELIEIERAMVKFRDAVIFKCDKIYLVNEEMCELSRCIGALRYSNEKISKSVEVKIDPV